MIDMKKAISHAVLLLLLTLFPFFCLIGQTDNETERILNAAEILFKSMKNRDYKGIWDHLSHKSRQTIIKDVYKELTKKEKGRYTVEEIGSDFNECGTLCKSYWGVFLQNFDPHIALEESTWSMGPIKPSEAEIIIRYRTSAQPARLKMYKEENLWKVGLTETFWSRK